MIIEKAERKANEEVLSQLFNDALSEVIRNILVELGNGRRPDCSSVPVLSRLDNGLPSLADAHLFSQNGLPEYINLILPRYGDENQRQSVNYPLNKFPAFNRLVDYISNNKEITPAYLPDLSDRIMKFIVEIQIEEAVKSHFARFGEVESTEYSREKVLRFFLNSLFKDNLDLAIVVPIAMTHFAFDRMRLNQNSYVIRMSDSFQKARWSAKAYGVSGHNSVLAAATHALVISGWSIANSNHLGLPSLLSRYSPQASDSIERFFSMLRLETGIDTGYAQGLYLARRWRASNLFGSGVYGVGVRRYPEKFDDFGWNSAEIPTVTKAQMSRVALLLNNLDNINNSRLDLAVKRFNSAMIRSDPSDAVLDATIALEILLGDAESQAISWKLRMRAAALAGIIGSKEAMEQARLAIGEIYGLRSAIVHGATRRRDSVGKRDPEDGKQLAINTLRSVIRTVIAFPIYLDPLVIDSDLMLIPTVKAGNN